MFCFFFKQKTAYEMRISDWSSDVCSSDLGSSRDWAAKGVRLAGVEAIVAEGFERIHRSNLVGMGVLPLEFKPGTNRHTLNIDGTETLDRKSTRLNSSH